MNPNTHLKLVLMDIIPDFFSKSLSEDTTFSKYILIMDAYFKIPKLYGIKNITTEEFMDKVYMSYLEKHFLVR